MSQQVTVRHAAAVQEAALEKLNQGDSQKALLLLQAAQRILEDTISD